MRVAQEICRVFKNVFHRYSLRKPKRIIPVLLLLWGEPPQTHFVIQKGINDINKYVKFKLFSQSVWLQFSAYFIISHKWGPVTALESFFSQKAFSKCLHLTPKAGEGRWGTDELAFNEVLAKRSHKQLQATFQAYQMVSDQGPGQGVPTETASSIISRRSRDLEDGARVGFFYSNSLQSRVILSLLPPGVSENVRKHLGLSHCGWMPGCC